ncbi:hypothetical protein JYK14_24430 [Siccirubricoccus sp. KC 17139]|uniref:Uncharacterized protein n=1 Tax=Siccirubricoccus soli TaxID=2899147 RepID=A0ABT1DCG1_9PROT|nr:hypothetical protein [Siccirubricoccus soli]MCO6419282.1 hypothetical protein [Siccirubricoccus soli]MCP2685417.1 hypothetical protein [Siccirubricoccus soli]
MSNAITHHVAIAAKGGVLVAAQEHGPGAELRVLSELQRAVANSDALPGAFDVWACFISDEELDADALAALGVPGAEIVFRSADDHGLPGRYAYGVSCSSQEVHRNVAATGASSSDAEAAITFAVSALRAKLTGAPVEWATHGLAVTRHEDGEFIARVALWSDEIHHSEEYTLTRNADDAARLADAAVPAQRVAADILTWFEEGWFEAAA